MFIFATLLQANPSRLHEAPQLSHDLCKASLSPLPTPLPVPALSSQAMAQGPGQHQAPLLLPPLSLLAPWNLGVPS